MVEGSLLGARNRADVESAKSTLRDIFALVQGHLSKIVLSIIKSGAEGKEGILQYFAHVLKMNLDRGKLQVCLALFGVS